MEQGATGLPLIPVGVVLGRGMLFYPGAVLLSAVAATTVWALLREVATHAPVGPARRWLRGANALAIIPVAVAWATVATDTAVSGPAAWLPVCGIIGGGLCIELSLRAGRDRGLYRMAGATVVAVNTAVNVLAFDGVLTAAVALVAGVVVAACAFAERRVWLLVPAAISGGTGLGDLVSRAVGAFELGAWGWLALIGTAAVLAGSVVERAGPRWVAIWRRTPAAEQG